MTDKFSASGDVEAWFKKNEEQPVSDTDFEPLHDAGHLDAADAPPSGPEEEVTEALVRPSNVIPFPKSEAVKLQAAEAKQSWLAKAKAYVGSMMAGKPVEAEKLGWRVDPANFMTEAEAEAALAEGDQVATKWFKNAEPALNVELEEGEPERKQAVGE